MSFQSLLIHSVAITNPTTQTGEDRYGNPLFGSDTFSTAARMEPKASGEKLIDRDTRTTAYMVYLPSGTVCSGLSTLVWEGRDFRAVGEPRRFDDGVGGHHLELDLEEILG